MQNAYIESFNGRFRDECFWQHWFASLSHMRSVIDNWREDYNQHRPAQQPELCATGEVCRAESAVNGRLCAR